MWRRPWRRRCRPATRTCTRCCGQTCCSQVGLRRGGGACCRRTPPAALCTPAACSSSPPAPLAAGGTCRCPGFRERLYAELRPLVPDDYEVGGCGCEGWVGLDAWQGAVTLRACSGGPPVGPAVSITGSCSLFSVPPRAPCPPSPHHLVLPRPPQHAPGTGPASHHPPIPLPLPLHNSSTSIWRTIRCWLPGGAPRCWRPRRSMRALR